MTKKKKSKTKALTVPETEIAPVNKALSVAHEMFCQLYVNNSEFFGNATFCYAAAYNIDLEKGSHKTKRKQYTSVSSMAARLLGNVSIRERITALLNDLMKDEIVDAELSKMIQQNRKLDVKVQAIREYNRIKSRVKPNQNNNLFQLNITQLREEYE